MVDSSLISLPSRQIRQFVLQQAHLANPGRCILAIMNAQEPLSRPSDEVSDSQPSPNDPPGAKLVVAISSRALFDLDESHQIFVEQGEAEYSRYQVSQENTPLNPGVAFRMARKLLAINRRYATPAVEVVLISRNSGDTGLRVFNSIRHHQLDITRAAFTRGAAPYRYIAPFGAQLFLSASAQDVRNALDAGIAAATILPSGGDDSGSEQLRIAFDGDAVLFSDEAERIFAASGLAEFNRSETESRETPLPGGPFKPFLAALHAIQSDFPAQDAPIRTALITARGAPAHERVIKTLRSWGIRIDEALFLSGKDKGAFLGSFGADIFFDDQMRHCGSAADYVATGHVPYGVKNPADS
jgi:5'-nucleotidase